MQMQPEPSILLEVASRLLASYRVEQPVSAPCPPRPDPEQIGPLIEELRSLLFPGFTGTGREPAPTPAGLVERLGALTWRLVREAHAAHPHTCDEAPCPTLEESFRKVERFIQDLPEIRRILLTDVQAAFDGDPAAKDFTEVILAYPGLLAVTVYRLAHRLHQLGVPLLPRMMTEHAHSLTGIDIHPGAEIGEAFFIDHGTGVVIGETTRIGNRVKLYQGVTLGALSFPKDERGQLVRGQKRHPTIEDDVTIYSGATILGGDTVVGAGSVIGGNVWLIESVPPGSRVLNRPTVEMRSAPAR